MTMNSCRMGRLAALAFLAALAVPVAAAAQSELDASEAEAFFGDWVVPLQTPEGDMDMAFTIEDMDGKVAARVGIPEQGEEEITDIRKREESLILSYMMDAQGMLLPISVTLRPDGENLSALLDVGGGMFTLNGTARRAGG